MLLISDANIFIDLFKLGLLEKFDKLNFALATTDFVVQELNNEQQNALSKLDIQTIKLSGDEIGLFYGEFSLVATLHISYADYSVFYAAKKYDGVVLSNDKALRNFTNARNVKVKGIFYILDTMVELGIESSARMIEYLKELARLNSRLPAHEIEKRIEKYTLTNKK